MFVVGYPQPSDLLSQFPALGFPSYIELINLNNRFKRGHQRVVQ